MQRILVIEDEQDILYNIVELLRLEDFEPLTAVNGKMGLALAISEQPDVILCDIRMPQMNGYQVLDALQANSVTVDIPFIFMSSHANKDDVAQVQAMGIDYLVKPFMIADLMACIRQYIDKGS